jgi:hypothetical protein
MRQMTFLHRTSLHSSLGPISCRDGRSLNRAGPIPYGQIEPAVTFYRDGSAGNGIQLIKLHDNAIQEA